MRQVRVLQLKQGSNQRCIDGHLGWWFCLNGHAFSGPLSPAVARRAIGGFAGLAVGLLFVTMTVRRRSQDHLPPQQMA